MTIGVPPVPGLRYSDALFNGESIAGIGDAFSEAMDKRRLRKRENDLRSALSGPLPRRPDGSADYGAMAERVMGIDPETGLTLTRLAETQLGNDFLRNKPSFEEFGGGLYQMPTQAGGEPEMVIEPPKKEPVRVGQSLVDPETFEPLYTDPTRSTVTPTDRKAIFASEDENIQLDGTVQALNRALELNDKTFTGFGASARATAGSRLPDWAVPDAMADRGTSDATTEWQNIMSPEAIKAMSATLTGATTNFELQKFEQILSDVSTPPDIRKRTIERMLQIAQRKRQLNNTRIQELRNAMQGEDLIAGPAAPEQEQLPTNAPLNLNQGPPPGWTQEEWNALTPEEKALFGQ